MNRRQPVELAEGRLDLFRRYGWQWCVLEGLDGATEARAEYVFTEVMEPGRAVGVWHPYDGREPRVWGRREDVRDCHHRWDLRRPTTEKERMATGKM